MPFSTEEFEFAPVISRTVCLSVHREMDDKDSNNTSVSDVHSSPHIQHYELWEAQKWSHSFLEKRNCNKITWLLCEKHPRSVYKLLLIIFKRQEEL